MTARSTKIVEFNDRWAHDRRPPRPRFPDLEVLRRPAHRDAGRLDRRDPEHVPRNSAPASRTTRSCCANRCSAWPGRCTRSWASSTTATAPRRPARRSRASTTPSRASTPAGRRYHALDPGDLLLGARHVLHADHQDRRVLLRRADRGREAPTLRRARAVVPHVRHEHATGARRRGRTSASTGIAPAATTSRSTGPRWTSSPSASPSRGSSLMPTPGVGPAVQADGGRPALDRRGPVRPGGPREGRHALDARATRCVLRLFGKLVEVAFIAVPDEIRLHPRALAAYRRAAGRLSADAPLVEAPCFMAPPRDRRRPADALCTADRRPMSLIERAGSLMHTTFSLAGLRPAAQAGKSLERQPESHARMVRRRHRRARRRPRIRRQGDPAARRRPGERRHGALPDHSEAVLHLRHRRDGQGVAGEAPGQMRDGDRRRPGRRSGGMFGGGSDQAGMGFVLISELCRVCMGVVTGMGVSLGLTVPTIASRGTLAQQERWLPGLVTYEKIGAWAITEPDSGSDAFGGMKSYVVRDGDDYILNGQKTFITNGPDADVVVVYAKLDEGDPQRRQARPQGADLRPRPRHGGFRPVEAVPQDGDSQLAHRRAVLRQRAARPRPAARRDRGQQGTATAATARGPTSPPSGSASPRWRSASSRNACACPSTTPRRARCGVRRSASSS